MNRIFILTFLSFGFLSAQDSTDFNKFFGITYSPFGQEQVRQSPGFGYGYFDDPEIGVSKNEFNMFFTSTFGVKVQQNTFLIFDLNINKGSFLVENSSESVTNNSGTIEESLTLITPKIGIKYFLTKRKHVAPYFRLAFSKTIANASFGDKENVDRFRQGEFFERLNSPFGIELGTGTEINFMEQLSFFLDAKFVYKRTNFILDKQDYTFTELLKTVAFGFNMYF